MKINRYLNAFTDLNALELEAPTVCLVIGCVSGRRNRRYLLRSPMELYIDFFNSNVIIVITFQAMSCPEWSI
jgi:hypothetical protein